MNTGEDETDKKEYEFDFAADTQNDIPVASVSRHTRGVKFARILFPLIALGILIYLMIIPFFSDNTVIRKNTDAAQEQPAPAVQTQQISAIEIPEKPAANSDALQMTNPHFDGLDKKGRPFTVTADNVVQDDGNISSDMTLSNPVADMQVKQDQSMSLTARVGVYNRTGQTLDLNGDVSLFHDNGYNLTGQSMKVDLNGGNAETNDPAFLHGSDGSIEGKGGMQMNDFGNRIIFKGPAKLILKPKKDKK